MRMRVVALEPAEFEAWQDAQLDGAEMPTDELALEGREIFRTTCSSCHLVEGEGGNEDLFEGSAQVPAAAPNLTPFMRRATSPGAVFALWPDLAGTGDVDRTRVV